jgi:hypothetical protein
MSRYLQIFLQVLLVGVILSAQMVSAQVANGTILGVVQDASGAVIPGVSVTVKNLDTGITRSVTTDEGGRYTVPNLTLGNYEVDGQLAGFQTEVRTGITITVGREAVVNLALKVGQVSDKVTITEEAPLVESTTAAMSSLVDERTIRDLPLNGRSWDNLALLQPGVVTVGAGQGSPAFDFGTGARFNVNGSRAYANSFLLDGTDINDHANGTPGGSAGTNLGVDGVQEFKINTLVSPAEFGRSSGGTVSAVTRSGTNDFHGAAFEFLRNNAMDSPGYFDQVNHGGTGSIAPYRRNQFGAALGGPIQKDRTFFFGTYEGLRQGSGTTIGPEVPTAQTKLGIVPYSAFQGTDPNLFNCHKGDTACVVPVNPAIKPFLDLFQAPTPGSTTGDLGDGTGFFIAAPLQVTNENYFMNRVDHQINSKMNMFVRYSFDSDTNVIPNFQGSSVANEQDVARRQYSTIQFSNILRPNIVNSFRFAYNRTYQNFDDVVVDPRAQQLSFLAGEHFGTISFGAQGLSTNPLNFLGVDNGAPRIYWYNLFQYADDLTYVKGRHSFKMGVDARRIQDNLISSSNSRGNYTFQDIPGFLANKPIRFDAPSPGSKAYRGDRQTMFGTYLQDDFKVSPRLTLNLGLRYEFVTNPYEVNGKMANLLHLTDPAPTVLKDSFFSIGKKEFQPRVGFAWGLNASGKTVLRAGFGIYNDHILPYSYGNFSTGYPPFFTTLSDLRDPSTAFTNPIGFPFDPALSAGTPPPPQFGGFPTGTIKEPYKTSFNFSVQQQVMNNTVLEMAYIGSESHRLQRNGEWNPPTPISPGVFPAVFNQNNRINPRFASLTVARFDVNANYNALQVSLKRKGASGLQYQVAYTYAKSIDEKSTLAGGESRQEPNTVLDLTDVKRDRGRSSFDARQNFVPTVTYPLPFRFQQKALGLIAGGWTVNGIATFRTGEPFTGRIGNNRSANGDRWSPDRPNLNPGYSNDPTSGVTQGCAGVAAGQKLGTPSLWYDPCAFSRPAPGTYGNLARNTITGPGFYNFDFSADKLFKPSDRVGVQLRAEIFNLLDQAHFFAPGFNVFSGSAGHITKLISSPGGRLIQLGAKITF